MYVGKQKIPKRIQEHKVIEKAMETRYFERMEDLMKVFSKEKMFHTSEEVRILIVSYTILEFRGKTEGLNLKKEITNFYKENEKIFKKDLKLFQKIEKEEELADSIVEHASSTGTIKKIYDKFISIYME